MTLEPTGDTAESRLTLTRLGSDMRAVRTRLGRKRGRHEHNCAAVLPRVPLDGHPELPPALVKYGPVEPRFLTNAPSRLGDRASGRGSHLGYAQVLKHDQPVRCGEVMRGLVGEVVSTMPHSLEDSRNRAHSATSAV